MRNQAQHLGRAVDRGLAGQPWCRRTTSAICSPTE
jgi:hypothetical protein